MTQLHNPGEYATIKVEVPATHLPSNLLDPHLFTGAAASLPAPACSTTSATC